MKDILIVDAGRIGTVIADLLAGTGDYAVTVADRDSAAVERIGTGMAIALAFTADGVEVPQPDSSALATLAFQTQK